MRYHFTHAGQSYRLELNRSQANWDAYLDGKHISVSVKAGEELELLIDGHPQRVAWAKQGRKIWLHLDGHSYELERAAGGQAAAAASGERVLRAPMPGQVVKVQVQTGDLVKAGGVLVLLEAMKMEVRIQAPWDAKVTQVTVAQGQSVEKDQVLVELEADHAG